jgi:hypothetical protein
MTRKKGYFIITLVAILAFAVVWYITGEKSPEFSLIKKIGLSALVSISYFVMAAFGHESYLRQRQ